MDVYVGNYTCSQDEIQEVLSRFGKCSLGPPKSQSTAGGKLYSFAKFERAEDAEKCLAQRGHQTSSGHTVIINHTKQQNSNLTNRPSQYNSFGNNNKPLNKAGPASIVSPTISKPGLSAPPIANHQNSSVAEPESIRKFEGLLCYIDDLDSIYIQEMINCKALRDLSLELQDWCQRNQPPQQASTNMVCAALFSEDGVWYRCRIDETLPNNQFRVKFVDYGNMEVLPLSSMRPLDLKFSQLGPFAKRYRIPDFKLTASKSQLQTLCSSWFFEPVDISSRGNALVDVMRRADLASLRASLLSSRTVEPCSYPDDSENAMAPPLAERDTPIAHTKSRPKKPIVKSVCKTRISPGSSTQSSPGRSGGAGDPSSRLNAPVKPKKHQATFPNGDSVCRPAAPSIGDSVRKLWENNSKLKQIRKSNVLSDYTPLSQSLTLLSDSSPKFSPNFFAACHEAWSDYERIIKSLRNSKTEDEELIEKRNSARGKLCELVESCGEKYGKLQQSDRLGRLKELAVLLENDKHKQAADFSGGSGQAGDAIDRLNRWKVDRQGRINPLIQATDNSLQIVSQNFLHLSRVLLVEDSQDFLPEMNGPPNVEHSMKACMEALKNELAAWKLAPDEKALLGYVTSAAGFLLNQELSNLQTLQADFHQLQEKRDLLAPWLTRDAPGIDRLLSLRKEVKSHKSKLRHKLADLQDLLDEPDANPMILSDLQLAVSQLQSSLHSSLLSLEKETKDMRILADQVFPELSARYPELQGYPELQHNDNQASDWLVKSEREITFFTFPDPKSGLTEFNGKPAFIKTLPLMTPHQVPQFVLDLSQRLSHRDMIYKIDMDGVFFSKSGRELYVQFISSYLPEADLLQLLEELDTKSVENLISFVLKLPELTTSRPETQPAPDSDQPETAQLSQFTSPCKHVSQAEDSPAITPDPLLQPETIKPPEFRQEVMTGDISSTLIKSHNGSGYPETNDSESGVNGGGSEVSSSVDNGSGFNDSSSEVNDSGVKDSGSEVDDGVSEVNSSGSGVDVIDSSTNELEVIHKMQGMVKNSENGEVEN